MIKISIKNQFKDDYISRVAGERLRLVILEAKEKGSKVQIDFSGVIVGSTSFFDEAIAKLAEEGWDSKILKETVILKGINKLDFEVLKKVAKYRGLVIKLT